MGKICSMLLLMLLANGDTLLLSAGWTLGGGRLTAGTSLLLAGVTSLLTGLSLWAGARIGGWFPVDWARRLAAVLLMGSGLWTLADAFREEGETAPRPDTLRDTLLLAVVLAVNNIGIGAAAGTAGMSPMLGCGVNFLACLLCLHLGSGLGRRGTLYCSQRGADVLSAVLLVILGIGLGWM